VLRRERLLSAGQTSGDLEVTAHGEDRLRCGLGQREGFGHPAASPAHHHGAEGAGAYHRVVDPPDHVPVVQEEEIRHPAKAFQCLSIAATNGLLGEVRRGHHQGRRHGVAEELNVQGSRGHEHPQVVQPGSHARGELVARGAGGKNDRGPR